MTEKSTILSTKILTKDNKQVLLDAGFEVIENDFIEIKHSLFEMPNIENEALIFTSKNAVLSVLKNKNVEKLKQKNIFCVGMKTRDLLEKNGFTVEVYTDYAEDLAEIISLIYKEEKFIFFCGNLRKQTLSKTLKSARINIDEIEVYQTTLSPQLVKNQFDGILFFSPSGVESYVQKNKIKKEICFCIGETTAETVEKYTKNIIVAEFPSTENMIESIINEFV